MLTSTDSKILLRGEPLSCRVRETMKVVLGEMAKEKAMDDLEDGQNKQRDEAYLREVSQVKRFILQLARCVPDISGYQEQNGELGLIYLMSLFTTLIFYHVL